MNWNIEISERVRELRTLIYRFSGGPGFQKKAINGRTGGLRPEFAHHYPGVPPPPQRKALNIDATIVVLLKTVSLEGANTV